ncbi:hypothetical protein MMC14_002652 [Varicellaria rhodocarpa]|nr:hypothetical protein [Varicellaria rhodocarpa]
MTFNSLYIRIFVPLTLACILSFLFFSDQIRLGLMNLTTQIQYRACPIPLDQYAIEKIFQIGTDFEDIDASASQSGKHAILTPNGGFLQVQEEDDVLRHYGVSMFHQLHCLGMIRELVLRGTLGGDASIAQMNPDDSDDKDEEPHWLHCFNYIAEGIICAADSTIEPPRIKEQKDGKNRSVIDGIGHTHQCRDSKPVWDIVFNSEKAPPKAWAFRKGDSIHRVFLH